MKQPQLIYALREESLVHVDEVENGLACGCHCPACGEVLIAKKGNVKTHHFAHRSGKECTYGYESSLHLLAKRIIAESKKMMIPAVAVEFHGSYKSSEHISDEMEISVDRVELEKKLEGFVPDIAVYAGGKCLLIEIFVTHQIDEAKLEKIRKLGISTIEINLSRRKEAVTEAELRRILLDSCTEKVWKHNAVAAKYYAQLYAAAERKKVFRRGYEIHVEDCPAQSRKWHGKAYANVMDDCTSCPYCIAYEYEDGLLCTGRAKVSSIADLRKR